MKNVVITGSTRGIGYGLADALLDLGCKVTISGRSQASVDKALDQLTVKFGSDRLHGCPCDVVYLEQNERLWDSAVARFGKIDIWINNAGIGHTLSPMWELKPDTIASIVNTNILGLMYGSQVAIQGMLEQGHGQLYNMLGHGASGNVRNGMSVYGTTKSAVNYLSKALIDETKDTPIQVGTLSPGMVTTDMLLDQLKADPEILTRNKRIFNIISDHVETVAPWMAQKILANDKTDAHIRWLTTPKMMWRFLTAPFNKRDLFEELSL